MWKLQSPQWHQRTQGRHLCLYNQHGIDVCLQSTWKTSSRQDMDNSMVVESEMSTTKLPRGWLCLFTHFQKYALKVELDHFELQVFVEENWMKLSTKLLIHLSIHSFEETASASEICQVAHWITKVIAQHELKNITFAIPAGLEELSSGCSGGSKVGYHFGRTKF